MAQSIKTLGYLCLLYTVDKLHAFASKLGGLRGSQNAIKSLHSLLNLLHNYTEVSKMVSNPVPPNLCERVHEGCMHPDWTLLLSCYLISIQSN